MKLFLLQLKIDLVFDILANLTVYSVPVKLIFMIDNQDYWGGTDMVYQCLVDEQRVTAFKKQ